MRYTSDHKAATRDKVLKEASIAIRSEGVGNVSVASIMQRAGLTHGGFYAHFASKDELVTQAIGQMFDERYDRVFSYGHAADPRATLTGFVTYYLSARHRDAPERGCPIPTLNGAMAQLSPDARARFVAGVGNVTAGLASLLAALGFDDATGLARSTLSEMVGAVVLARSDPDPETSDLILAASRKSIAARLRLDDIA